MLLEINHIAKIKRATVEINDITVITGQNNSGKSTFGKLIHAIYAAIDLYQNNYLFALKYTSILEELENLNRWVDGKRASEVKLLYKDLQSALYQQKRKEDSAQEEALLQDAYLTEEIDVLLNNIQQEMTLKPYFPNRKTIAKMVENISELQKQPIADHAVFAKLLERLLNLEFPASLISKFSLTKSARVTLKEDNGDLVQLSFKNNHLDTAGCTTDLTKKYKKAIYLDDPFLLDALPDTSERRTYGGAPSEQMKQANESNYRLRLIEQMKKGEVSRQVRGERIANFLSEVLVGELVHKQAGYYYFSKEFPNGIPFSAMSSGMKPFAMLQILLQNGLLASCEYLIFDEPETHLHPQWQIKFAELIVLLAEAYSLKILVTSHSPYFIEALDIFSAKLDTKFYCAEPDRHDARLSVLREVTGNLEPIYKELYQPLCELEELRIKQKKTRG
ncbi:ATP-binding protein [Enterococcus sp. 669A]|uniref:ATP-binding protein n=1 Tax=Candidatus Enterococcus moelleringii TaxID=2815325 RepID=A0ABS3L4P4_9ENTE|nr:ATP-binding protein [Enterococcus sp. 669A]MBO1304586.1 ATP-binding protein [Enterococcus sp. 669A]